MKSFLSILLVALALLVQSCGTPTPEDTLEQAEHAMLKGNVALALSACESLRDSTGALSATQLCRVAIIYAKASEHTDNQDYMATAAQCYELAQSLDADTDSLNRYIETLDIEHQGVVRVIREVSHAMKSPLDYPDTDGAEQEYLDSLDVEP